MDSSDYQEAVQYLDLSARDVQLLGRLLDQREHLVAWRDYGASSSGALASDALDQARGLLEELAAGEAARLLSVVQRLLAVLPAAAE